MTLAWRLEGGFTSTIALNRGLSDEAHAVRRMEREAIDLTPSIALGEIRLASLKALITSFTQAQKDGWDGYDASPADPATLYYALQFLSDLPTTIPSPEIAIDTDGDVALEWDRGPRRIFSVRITRDGTLYFAGLVGHSTFHGTEVLREGIPETIAAGIERIIRTAIV